MLDKLKKHSVKIFVFTINVLLAAIAVLIIRGKDQARLLQEAAKEKAGTESVQNSQAFPGFESSVSAENIVSEPAPANVPVDNSSVAPSVPDSTLPTPAPATASPSNAKTKTS